MEVRPARVEDLDGIGMIFADAKRTMVRSGNTRQWAGEYPSAADALRDVERGVGYVCLGPDGSLAGYSAIIPSPEPTYAQIYEGQWIDDSAPYLVIHRIAAREGAHGVFETFISYALSLCPNVRIDTHRDNVIMQHLLARYGFSYCGIIFLLSGDERLAYQKLI